MLSDEDEILKRLDELSGLSKQEYLINQVLHKDVVVRPNPYVHKCTSKQLNYFISLLEKQSFDEMNGDDKEIMCLMFKINSELKRRLLGCLKILMVVNWLMFNQSKMIKL